MTKSKDSGGSFTFLKGDVGWTGLMPRAVTPEGSPDARVRLERRRVVGGQVSAQVARAVITNTSSRPLRVQAIRWVSDASRVWPPPALRFPRALDPHYFATENFRGDFFATGTTRGEHFLRPLPNEMVSIGVTDDAYFPGVFVGSAVRPVGLLCAAGSSDVLSTSFRLYGGDGQTTWNFEIEQTPQGLPWITLASGKSLAGEWIYFAIIPSGDPQQSTGGYYRWLRGRGVFDRVKKNPTTNPLPRQRIWGSWNYGPMVNVDEAFVLRQLPLLRAHFPSVKFVQVDDGYERIYPTGERAQMDLLYGLRNPDEAFNPAKFPSGPRELVRQIKQAGLRPATWLGLWVAGTSPLVRENPDWLLRDDMGRTLTFNSPFTSMTGKPMNVYVLDPSVAAVRKYIDRVLKTVFTVWGFEGLKFDFFSFAFQIRRARFRKDGRTAAQYLRWLIDTCRKYMPADGFLGMCSVAGTGTPFYNGADYFRFAEDVSHGGWDLIKRVALWTVNTNMLLQEHPVLTNIDSLGWSKAFKPQQWRTCLALFAVSGGTVEIAGDIAALDADKIEMMNRCLALCDPLRPTRCLDIPWGRIANPPSLWLSHAPGRGALAAIINWADRPAEVPTRRLDEAWPGWRKARPAWEGQSRITSTGVHLPAHGSLLVGDIPR